MDILDGIDDMISVISGEKLIEREENERRKIRKRVRIITPIVLIICVVILYFHSKGYIGIVPKIALGVALLCTILFRYG